MVYFITDGEYFKIGYSNNSRKRMSFLQTGNHRKLSLVTEIDGGYGSEYWFHKNFQHKNIQNEWFDISKDEVTSAIEHYLKNKDSIMKGYYRKKTKQLKMDFKENRFKRNPCKRLTPYKYLSPEEKQELIHQALIWIIEDNNGLLKINTRHICELIPAIGSRVTVGKNMLPKTLRLMNDVNNNALFASKLTLDKFIKFCNTYDESKTLDFYASELGMSKRTVFEFRKIINDGIFANLDDIYHQLN